jgi:hypothetical protein
MKNFIPFQSKLREKLDPILTRVGFVPVEILIEQIMPTIIYERENSNDQIRIYALVRHTRDNITINYFNWLRMDIIVDNKVTKIVPPKPNPPSSPYALRGWIYTNEEELHQHVNEITGIVKNELYNWFKGLS